MSDPLPDSTRSSPDRARFRWPHGGRHTVNRGNQPPKTIGPCTIDTTGSSNDSQAHYFVIADGIIAVEGDGSLNGTQKALHTFLLAHDPAAADAELTRLLGLSLDRIRYIQEAGRFIGNISQSGISKLS
jgi:hypothetical protein